MHEVVWTHEFQQNKKSEWVIAKLSFPLFVYFPVAVFIDLNDLLDDITFLLLTNQGSWFCLDRSAGRPEIAMYGGRSHYLKMSQRRDDAGAICNILGTLLILFQFYSLRWHPHEFSDTLPVKLDRGTYSRLPWLWQKVKLWEFNQSESYIAPAK